MSVGFHGSVAGSMAVGTSESSLKMGLYVCLRIVFSRNIKTRLVVAQVKFLISDFCV